MECILFYSNLVIVLNTIKLSGKIPKIFSKWKTIIQKPFTHMYDKIEMSLICCAIANSYHVLVFNLLKFSHSHLHTPFFLSPSPSSSSSSPSSQRFVLIWPPRLPFKLIPQNLESGKVDSYPREVGGGLCMKVGGGVWWRRFHCSRVLLLLLATSFSHLAEPFYVCSCNLAWYGDFDFISACQPPASRKEIVCRS